nr:putative reverse transcriptase domain-containing protein [Tanacetum cinerariifolium]
PWRCEVKGKYDVKRNFNLFSWKGRKIAMVSPKVTPQLPKPEVKVEEKIIKAEVVDEHIKKIQDLQNYKQQDDKISTSLFETTNKVGTLKTCEEIMGFNDDEDVKGLNFGLKRILNAEHTTRCFGSWTDRWEYGRRVKKYEGFRVDVKRKSIKDKVRREVFDVVEALDIENSRASSFQMRGIHVVETKLRKANVVADVLSRKERVKPKQVRAMSMKIQSGIKEKLLATQNEATKEENAPVKMLSGLDQQMEKKGDGGLYFMDRIWVPLIGDLRTIIMDETHATRYSIHPRADKMY